MAKLRGYVVKRRCEGDGREGRSGVLSGRAELRGCPRIPRSWSRSALQFWHTVIAGHKITKGTTVAWPPVETTVAGTLVDSLIKSPTRRLTTVGWEARCPVEIPTRLTACQAFRPSCRTTLSVRAAESSWMLSSLGLLARGSPNRAKDQSRLAREHWEQSTAHLISRFLNSRPGSGPPSIRHGHGCPRSLASTEYGY